MEYHNTGNVFSETADKYKVFIFRFDESLVPFDKIVPDFIDGTRRYRYKALFAPFPFDFYKAFIEIQIGYFQVA